MTLTERDRVAPAPGRTATAVTVVAGRRVLLLDVLALAVVVLGLAVTVLALRAGALTGQDLEAQASGRGALAALVDGAAGGGPLSRLGEALVARFAPLDHTVVLVLGVAVRAALAAGIWILLRRVLAPRPALLVPFAVVAAHPLLLPETATLPGVLGPLTAAAATAWALAAAVAWGRRRRRGDLAVLVGASVVALGAHPAGALVPAVLAGAGVAGVLGQPSRWLRATGAAGGVVLTGAVLSLATGTPLPVPALPTAATLARALRELLAGLAGGPWSWVLTPAGQLQPGPIPVHGLAAGVAVALVLAATAALRPRRALTTLVPALLWVGGAAWLGATSSAAAGLSVALGLAVLRHRGEAGPGPVTRLQSRVAAGRRLPARLASVRVPRRLRLGAGVAVTAVLVFAAATSVLTASAGAKLALSASPVGPWLAAVRASVSDLPPFPRLLPRPVPDAVAAGATVPTLLDAALVRLLRPDVLLHNADGPALALDDSGRLGAAVADPIAGTVPGGLCVATFQPGGRDVTWVPLPRPAPVARGALIRLELLVTGTTLLEVSLRRPDGSSGALPTWSADLLDQGPHTVVYPVPVGTVVAAVGVRPRSPIAGLCVVAAQVVVPR